MWYSFNDFLSQFSSFFYLFWLTWSMPKNELFIYPFHLFWRKILKLEANFIFTKTIQNQIAIAKSVLIPFKLF